MSYFPLPVDGKKVFHYTVTPMYSSLSIIFDTQIQERLTIIGYFSLVTVIHIFSGILTFIASFVSAM